MSQEQDRQERALEASTEAPVPSAGPSFEHLPLWPKMLSDAFDSMCKAIGSDVRSVEVYVIEDGDLGVVTHADSGPEIFKVVDTGEGWKCMRGVAIISEGDFAFGLAAARAVNEYVSHETDKHSGRSVSAVVCKCPCCDGWGKRERTGGASSSACEAVTCPACNGKCVVWA